MKEINTKQNIDPAEICECNPEWSSSPDGNDWDECRCSIIDPAEPDTNNKKKDS